MLSVECEKECEEHAMGVCDVGKAQQGLVGNLIPEEALASGGRDLMQMDCLRTPG